MSLNTGQDTMTDYEGIAKLVKACNKSNVASICVGTTTIIFKSGEQPETVDKPRPLLNGDNTVQQSMFSPQFDTDIPCDIINDEGDSTDIVDVAENVEAELDMAMINDPCAYEDYLIQGLKNEKN